MADKINEIGAHETYQRGTLDPNDPTSIDYVSRVKAGLVSPTSNNDSNHTFNTTTDTSTTNAPSSPAHDFVAHIKSGLTTTHTSTAPTSHTIDSTTNSVQTSHPNQYTPEHALPAPVPAVPANKVRNDYNAASDHMYSIPNEHLGEGEVRRGGVAPAAGI